ncbi:rRNA maturation RNase YbeY [Geopsychrobacter electrodiphilus]|uniref:rRNA maturation RNase YbeY n=1 Tax=Geopsychrobacter electrodiphilus TaxID=225196 RepID=UPI000361B601|nr:rRNA maturation RNase YbeY [Geopsychrobacter electrodiphilus]
MGFPDGELSLLIVNNDEIQQINRDYLQRDRPTNVISFAMQEGEGAGVQPQLLGDVVISAERAAADAVDAEIPFEHELVFLLLHGILHLLGFDHERGTEEQAIEMEAKEREIFSLIQQEFLDENGFKAAL